jgi:hypothetical protein
MSKWGQQSRRMTGEHRRELWSIETENHHRVLWHAEMVGLTVGDERLPRAEKCIDLKLRASDVMSI